VHACACALAFVVSPCCVVRVRAHVCGRVCCVCCVCASACFSVRSRLCIRVFACRVGAHVCVCVPGGVVACIYVCLCVLVIARA
jgi:hypothetical protein